MRVFIISVFATSNLFWLLFGLGQFPWIVGPDYDLDRLRSLEHSSYAGAWLLLLSLIGTWLPTGVFGNRRVFLAISLSLIVGWVTATRWLYPSWSIFEYPYRLAFQVMGLAALIATTIMTYQSDKTIHRDHEHRV